jgi:hypothetical protein
VSWKWALELLRCKVTDSRAGKLKLENHCFVEELLFDAFPFIFVCNTRSTVDVWDLRMLTQCQAVALPLRYFAAKDACAFRQHPRMIDLSQDKPWIAINVASNTP